MLNINSEKYNLLKERKIERKKGIQRDREIERERVVWI